MPPRLVGDMSAADLEQYQMWLEYQKPMYMGLRYDEKGIWGLCGRCGAPVVELLVVRDGAVISANAVDWPKYCPKCGQRVKRGEDDE